MNRNSEQQTNINISITASLISCVFVIHKKQIIIIIIEYIRKLNNLNWKK